MSKIPRVSDHSSVDAHSQEDRGSLERKRRHADDEGFSPTSERRDSVRSRPLSWHPSAPVEPPLGSSQHRSIGVSSILNHPATEGLGVRTASVDAGRESLGEQPPLDLQTHSRFSSSSAVHLPSPSSMHPANPPALSPGMRSHQGIAPVSPSFRSIGAGGYFAPRAGPGQSPLSQQLPGLQKVAPSSPLPTDPSSGHPPPVSSHHHQASTHSASTFASHHANTNQTPTPSPKEPSPTTPASMFSQLGRSSPALSAAPMPQSAPLYMNSPTYAAVDPMNRLPLGMPGQRHSVSEAPGVDGPQSRVNAPPQMIECYIDYKSGSSTQAEKRKANSDASRRFRQRKRNDTQKDQKITTQQDEIRKQAETIQKQMDELHILREQREFYRAERDYFRDQASHFVQIPARPTSPHNVGIKPEANNAEGDPRTWTGSGVPLKTEETTSDLSSQQHQPGARAPTQLLTPHPGTMPGGHWSAPSAYPAQTDRVASGERQGQISPTSGAWNRTA
ncbi:uncharacterized protein BDV17DRAFT_85123 [Aspergillus undulatus]|uniref:uncharacterized protein n=1 Tax=Aspergillus undulatus TaxID=1810928 RepID=UPI003CCE4554